MSPSSSDSVGRRPDGAQSIRIRHPIVWKLVEFALLFICSCLTRSFEIKAGRRRYLMTQEGTLKLLGG